MFTGIIETIGKVIEIGRDGTNLRVKINSDFSHELKVDQSLNHNGVCLTVTKIGSGFHEVVAIKETISKTNFGNLSVGNELNLERAMKADGRFDGHIVQGHVDTIAKVTEVKSENGSWLYSFSYENSEEILVEKGSVCINGVSLTCFDILPGQFSVAIIPYTFEHTNFKNLKKGHAVNIEFDILGKYIKTLIKNQHK